MSYGETRHTMKHTAQEKHGRNENTVSKKVSTPSLKERRVMKSKQMGETHVR